MTTLLGIYQGMFKTYNQTDLKPILNLIFKPLRKTSNLRNTHNYPLYTLVSKYAQF